MKLYILADKEGKPIVKKQYKIPLTDNGGNDEYTWNMYISPHKEEVEKYIAMGGEGNEDKIFEYDM